MMQSRAIEMHCAWINFQEEDAKSRNQQILFTRNPIHWRMFGEQMQQMKEKYLFLWEQIRNLKLNFLWKIKWIYSIVKSNILIPFKSELSLKSWP